jgi:hypothetical protein
VIQGDRIRLVGTDEDGLPFVHYGFVTPDSPDPSSSPVVAILLDGELSTETVRQDTLEVVTVASIELTLQGDDLVNDPVLRRGLVAMWVAEAETAGLAIDHLCAIGDGDGERDERGCWMLAHATAGDDRYAIRACEQRGASTVVHVHAVSNAAPVCDCAH